jgi:hypothetical protein
MNKVHAKHSNEDADTGGDRKRIRSRSALDVAKFSALTDELEETKNKASALQVKTWQLQDQIEQDYSHLFKCTSCSTVADKIESAYWKFLGREQFTADCICKSCYDKLSEKPLYHSLNGEKYFHVLIKQQTGNLLLRVDTGSDKMRISSKRIYALVAKAWGREATTFEITCNGKVIENKSGEFNAFNPPVIGNFLEYLRVEQL